MAELVETPTDADAQAALRQLVKKQLTGDAAFQVDLSGILDELRAAKPSGIVQTSDQTGGGNVNVQIAGSGNQVGGFGRSS